MLVTLVTVVTTVTTVRTVGTVAAVGTVTAEEVRVIVRLSENTRHFFVKNNQ